MKEMSDIEIIAEGEEVLIDNLGIEKATRFWLAINSGQGDYLKLKDSLFKNKNVENLAKEIKEFQNKNQR